MTDTYAEKIQNLSLMELMMEWKHINELIKEQDTSLKVLIEQEKLIEENITHRDNLLIKKGTRDSMIVDNGNLLLHVLNKSFNEKFRPTDHHKCIKVAPKFSGKIGDFIEAYKKAQKEPKWDLSNAIVDKVDAYEIDYIKYSTLGYVYKVTIHRSTYELIKENPDRFELTNYGILDLTRELDPIHCLIDGESTKKIQISADAMSDNLYPKEFPKAANFDEDFKWMKVDINRREIDLDTEIKDIIFIDNKKNNPKLLTILAKNGITHLDQLIRLDEASILRWNRMGSSNLNSIKEFLKMNKLKLGMTEEQVKLWMK